MAARHLEAIKQFSCPVGSSSCLWNSFPNRWQSGPPGKNCGLRSRILPGEMGKCHPKPAENLAGSYHPKSRQYLQSLGDVCLAGTGPLIRPRPPVRDSIDANCPICPAVLGGTRGARDRKPATVTRSGHSWAAIPARCGSSASWRRSKTPGRVRGTNRGTAICSRLEPDPPNR